MTTKRIVSGWFVLVLLALPAAAAVSVGDEPTLAATAIDGSVIDLAKLRGKLVLIDFWTGRADSNKINERALIPIHKEFKDQGLEIIGICCDPRLEWSKKHIDDLKLPWPQVYGQDWKEGLGKEWGVPRVNWEYLISPDGKVIYVGDFRKLRAEIESALEKYPPRLVDPAVLEKASRELDAVETLLAEKNQERAILKFSRIGDEAMKDRPYAKRYDELRTKIDAAADALLTEADALIEAKQYPAAAVRLRELSEVMNALPTSSKPRLKYAELTANKDVQREMELAQTSAKAQAALEAARAVRDSGDNESAYAKFKAVAQDYPDTTAGRQAADVVKAYESDTAFMGRIRDRAVEGKAKAALALAENYRTAGQKDKARSKYEEIIKEYAGTSFADTARRALENLR